MSRIIVPKFQTGNAHLLPIDRYDPSLVLYLPLWYPYSDMTGSTIYSYDKNRHACTVTGATWGVTGRTFDAADDGISAGTSSVFDITVAVTIIAWIYPTLDSDQWGRYGGRWGCYELGQNSNDETDARFETTGTSTEALTTGTGIVTVNAWNHVAGTYNSLGGANNKNIYVGGAVKATATITNSMTASVKPVIVGQLTTDAQSYKGIIGDFFIYNRALSAGEIMRNYQLTKWRYS